jgi:hypothetical protein
LLVQHELQQKLIDELGDVDGGLDDEQYFVVDEYVGIVNRHDY